MPKKRKKKIDRICKRLYTRLCNGDESAISTLERSGNFKKFQALRQWWEEFGKTQYLADENKIAIVERNREIIESKIQEFQCL